MAHYNQIATFGGVYFEIGDVTHSEKSATLKTNIGKTFVEKDIPLRDNNNQILNIQGVITGVHRSSGTSQSDAIETDRAALIALDDGNYHAYDDGKHSGNFVIQKESLTWNDEAIREAGESNRFSMVLIEW